MWCVSRDYSIFWCAALFQVSAALTGFLWWCWAWFVSVSDWSFEKFLASTFQLCLACCFAKFLIENNRTAGVVVALPPPLPTPSSRHLLCVVLQCRERASFLLVSTLKTNSPNKALGWSMLGLEVWQRRAPAPLFAHACLRFFGLWNLQFPCDQTAHPHSRAPVLAAYSPFPAAWRGKLAGRTREIIRCPLASRSKRRKDPVTRA